MELSKVLTLIPGWAPKNSGGEQWLFRVYTLDYIPFKRNQLKINLASLLYYLCLVGKKYIYTYSYYFEESLSNFLPPIYSVGLFEKPGDLGGTWAMGLTLQWPSNFDFARLTLAWISPVLYLDVGYFPTPPQQLQAPQVPHFSLYRTL